MKLDARTKLIVVIVVGVMTFLTNGVGLMAATAVMAAYLMLHGMVAKAVKYSGVFFALYALMELMYATNNEMIAMFGLVLFYVLKFMPVVMAAAVLSAVSPGELISSLQSMRMPKAVVIPIAVGLRFMPSFFVEYAAIRDAARLRGVSISPQNLLTKPALTLECAYVPILMRSLTISDALAASACTRGLDNPNQRSSLHTSKIGFQDIAAYAILAAFVAALVYFRSF